MSAAASAPTTRCCRPICVATPPDISGVAHTTAKVTVSQMGRVIYETRVPAGPFRIQDLGDSVSGTLHVRIEEQNGRVQEYDISTASMPFLTRQGRVRYKVVMGRPQEWGHNIAGGFFLRRRSLRGLPTAGRSTAARWRMKTISRRPSASDGTSQFLARWPLTSRTHMSASMTTPPTAIARWTVTRSA